MQRFCKNFGTKKSMALQLVKRLIQFNEFSFEGCKIVYFLFNYWYRNFIFRVACVSFPFVIWNRVAENNRLLSPSPSVYLTPRLPDAPGSIKRSFLEEEVSFQDYTRVSSRALSSTTAFWPFSRGSQVGSIALAVTLTCGKCRCNYPLSASYTAKHVAINPGLQYWKMV
jgi:hypothetical protein